MMKKITHSVLILTLIFALTVVFGAAGEKGNTPPPENKRQTQKGDFIKGAKLWADN